MKTEATFQRVIKSSWIPAVLLLLLFAGVFAVWWFWPAKESESSKAQAISSLLGFIATIVVALITWVYVRTTQEMLEHQRGQAQHQAALERGVVASAIKTLEDKTEYWRSRLLPHYGIVPASLGFMPQDSQQILAYTRSFSPIAADELAIAFSCLARADSHIATMHEQPTIKQTYAEKAVEEIEKASPHIQAAKWLVESA
jgi:hypothetical protein